MRCTRRPLGGALSEKGIDVIAVAGEPSPAGTE